MTVSTQSQNENPNHLHYVDRRVVDNDFNVVRERPRNEKSMEIYGDARYNFAKTHRGSLVDGQLTIYSRYAQAVLAQFSDMRSSAGCQFEGYASNNEISH